MRPLFLAEMPVLLRPARALLPALLLLAGCGAAKSPPPDDFPGPTGGGGHLTNQEPSAPPFMSVGSMTVGVPQLESSMAAPSAVPILPPKGDSDVKSLAQKKDRSDGSPAQGQKPGGEAMMDAGHGDVPGGSQSLKRADVDSSGGLTEADVRATLVQKQSVFRSCYDIGTQGSPGGFSGTVGLRVTINALGAVAQAELTSSNTKNAQVDSCVLSGIRQMTFPSKGSGAVVSFPIDFGR